MRRLLGVVVHNWPLKLAAIGLATLLYGGLVLSQSTLEFKGVVPVTVENQPRRHVPADGGRTGHRPSATSPRRASGRSPTTFTATIDLADVKPGAGRQLVPIVVDVARPADHRAGQRPRRHDRRARCARDADRAGRRRPRRHARRPRDRRHDGRADRGRGVGSVVGHRARRRGARQRRHPARRHRHRPGRPARAGRPARRRGEPGRRGARDGPRQDPGLHRPPVADAAGHPGHHRDAGGRLRDRQRRRRSVRRDGRGRRRPARGPREHRYRRDLGQRPLVGPDHRGRTGDAERRRAAGPDLGRGHDHAPPGHRDPQLRGRAAPRRDRSGPPLRGRRRSRPHHGRRIGRRPGPPDRGHARRRPRCRRSRDRARTTSRSRPTCPPA